MFKRALRASTVDRVRAVPWEPPAGQQLPSNYIAPLLVARDGPSAAHHSKSRAMTLSHEKFLRRFIQHVLPTGFSRIRYFGFLANRNGRELLPLCCRLLAISPPVVGTTAPATSGHPCPRCHHIMRVVERFTAIDLLTHKHRIVTSIDSS
ncbi:MAG: transposase [Acidobacteriaceae bacterium]|nr:transposase [Acidobacteriaceae bacterium]